MNQLVTIAPANVPAIYSPMQERAREYARASRSASTLKAYRIDWADFEAWCAGQQLAALPATPDTVAAYIAAQAGSHKASTIQHRLSSISMRHQTAGYDSPTKNELVRSVLKGIRRELGTAPAEKAPLLATDVRAMVAALPDTLTGKRDRALLLLGFAGAFRRSELVALNVADLEFTADGIVVTIRRSKTDQEGQGRKLGIPSLPTSTACPVRAVRAWLEASAITEGPIFRPIGVGSRVSATRLSGQGVGIVVKRNLPRDRDRTKFAGHSLRSGFVSSAVLGGANLRAIMKTTGHRTIEMVLRYTRDANLFRGNAVASTGL